MVRNKLLLLLMLCFIIITQSCVHGDLDDCPPMVNYAVAFNFTHHMYGGDRFYDDAKKVNLYVFREQVLVHMDTTILSPYEPNFNVSLDLPMGKYEIIAWGNVRGNEHLTITPESFQKGVTTLQEARLTLKRNADMLCEADLEKILFGDLTAEIPLYASRIDTIPLISITNNIRVVLHWDHTDAIREPSGRYLDYDQVAVTLRGSNAVYNFYDTLVPVNNNVIYGPYDVDLTGAKLRTDVWNQVARIYYYPDQIDKITDSCVYDFKVLRLFPGNELLLNVIQTTTIQETINLLAPLGSANRNNVTFGEDIVGGQTADKGFSYFHRNQGSITLESMQSAFDKYDNYRIDVILKYNKYANTYISIMEVKIQHWHNVNIDVPVGPI